MDERNWWPSGEDQHGRPPDWPARFGSIRRVEEGRLAGGVAAGLAARTGFSVTIIRFIFGITAVLSGFGLAAYVLAWLFIPAEGDSTTIASKAVSDLRGLALAAVTASMLIVVLIIASILGIGLISSFSWPVVVGAGGLVLVWRNAPPAEQESLRTLARPLLEVTGAQGKSRLWLRGVIACVLLIVGLVILVATHRSLQEFRALAGAVLVLGGVLILLGPWWMRVVRDLLVERQARIRAEERADIAARVHDSVLQTLALIQRRADSPQQVIQLARAQERELRSWLFDGRPPGSMDGIVTTVAGGVRRIQQEVEAQHGVAIEAVTVGDCELDDDLNALLAAAREATVNAAKWSGAQVISVFAEVEPGEVSVFVRDRGKGFDPETVPDDRKGLAESVRARMTRRGGSATIKSVLGEGTEVALTIRRTADRRPADRRPSDQRPSDHRPSDQRPCDDKPSDQRPSDHPDVSASSEQGTA